MNIPVLDHGYVRLVESWGRGDAGIAEAAIIEAARQSTQGCFRGWEKDEKLLGYLYNSTPKHSTPFEFAGMTIEVQAPIFVFREWHRHRTQSYNEASARYAPLPDLYYLPEFQDVKDRAIEAANTKNRQASSEGITVPDNEAILNWLVQVQKSYDAAEDLYQSSLKLGIPKELARIVMPVGHYSKMRASANLLNWLKFLTLRDHPAAQKEIQRFAQAVGMIIGQEFPRVYRLFATER